MSKSNRKIVEIEINRYHWHKFMTIYIWKAHDHIFIIEFLDIQVETCSILTHFMWTICFIHVYYISKCDEKVWIHYFKDQIIYIVMSDRGPLNQYRSDTSSIKNNVRSTLRHIFKCLSLSSICYYLYFQYSLWQADSVLFRVSKMMTMLPGGIWTSSITQLPILCIMFFLTHMLIEYKIIHKKTYFGR